MVSDSMISSKAGLAAKWVDRAVAVNYIKPMGHPL
jgi:hypothetical protein